jgi:hypothetical protein
MCRGGKKEKPYIMQQMREAQMQMQRETKLLLLGLLVIIELCMCVATNNLRK